MIDKFAGNSSLTLSAETAVFACSDAFLHRRYHSICVKIASVSRSSSWDSWSVSSLSFIIFPFSFCSDDSLSFYNCSLLAFHIASAMQHYLTIEFVFLVIAMLIVSISTNNSLDTFVEREILSRSHFKVFVGPCLYFV